MRSPFLLALCQEGMERAVKAEAAASPLALRSSFQRKGFVTFKAARPIDVDEATFPSVFARHIGLQSDAPLENAQQVESIIDIDGKPWRSVHTKKNARTPWPLGVPPLTLPPEAPSRAWLKLEEATRLFDIPFEKGQRAVEIGSAPGGATYALLERGLEVVGIDPNEMDARIAEHPRFAHLRMTSMNVDVDALERYDWLLLDVNVPPRTALHGALPFVTTSTAREHLRGFVFTLKMKDASLAAEASAWLERIREAAGQSFALEARQLWSNGSEICVVGLRGRAQVSSSRR